MKRHVTSAALAALFTAVVFAEFLLAPIWRPYHWPRVLQLVEAGITWAALPARLILSLFGVHGGPDGMPDFQSTAVVTFFLSWMAIDFGPAVWKRLTNRGCA